MNRYRLIIGVACACLSCVLAWGQSRQVRKLEKQRSEVLKKIETTNKELQKVKQNGIEENKRLRLVKEQVANRKEVITIIGKEMSALQEQIDSLQGKITHLRSRENKLLDQYAESLRSLQRNEYSSKQLIFLLSAKSMEEARLRQNFLSKYATSASKVAQELKLTRSAIERTQNEVSQSHQQKAVVMAIRDKERKALEAEEGRRTANLTSLKGKEQQLSRDLSKQRKQASQLDAQIQAQIAAEIAAAEAKARKEQELIAKTQKQKQNARQSTNDVSTKKDASIAEPTTSSPRQSAIRGGYAMDASERKLSGSFAQNKGRLPMPVRGKYDLVRRFGTQQHSEHSRVSISNGGIDLRVYGDRNAYCVFEGIVSRVFVTAGYGQSIIVRHGNYLTVYANLTSVRVMSGQRVSAGTPMGTINSDDNDGRGNVLHFQLWHERNKQNPEAWIRR